MARASRCYTGSKQSTGTPTMNKESYKFMMRVIRKEMEKRNAKDKVRPTEVPGNRLADGSDTGAEARDAAGVEGHRA